MSPSDVLILSDSLTASGSGHYITSDSIHLTDQANNNLDSIHNISDSLSFVDGATSGVFVSSLIDSPSATLTVKIPYKAVLTVTYSG